MHNYDAPFTSHGKLHEFGAEKPAHFDFFTINFTVCSHIWSTGGDALSTSCHKYQLQEEKHSRLGTTTLPPALYRYHMGLNQILSSAIISSTHLHSHTHTIVCIWCLLVCIDVRLGWNFGFNLTQCVCKWQSGVLSICACDGWPCSIEVHQPIKSHYMTMSCLFLSTGWKKNNCKYRFQKAYVWCLFCRKSYGISFVQKNNCT